MKRWNPRPELRWLGCLSHEFEPEWGVRRKGYSQSRCFFLGPITSSVVALHTDLARPWPAIEWRAANSRSLMVWPDIWWRWRSALARLRQLQRLSDFESLTGWSARFKRPFRTRPKQRKCFRSNSAKPIRPDESRENVTKMAQCSVPKHTGSLLVSSHTSRSPKHCRESSQQLN